MNFYNSKEIVQQVNQVATSKANTHWRKTFVASLLAGGYIAMGSFLALMIGGAIPEIAQTNPGLQKLVFGGVFPLGLILVAVAGADLFTGNTAYFVPSVFSKRMSFKVPLKNWGIVYIGNFIGSLVVAWLFAYYTGMLKDSITLESTIAIGEKKVAYPFMVTLVKGIVCNWMVALAMWMAFASKDVVSKIVAIWFPIMAFVAMGFEHCVANMFFIPTAIFYGADITWTQFFIDNLIPVTIGNIIGGAFFVGTAYWYLYDKE
ncbi:formate/nitrite transporter [Balneicella halophila]|uniref:Formate/nitrite transporter n=1 Tax=Balneicella halophila TaxID=1537566 RepID=A0A7L4UPS3_BALHA|nr:formate/nitrite transporter family protein [Balneicella halophila]PVX49360.1 formate/nitrite transporter [Balneicella halophila]